MVAWKEEEEFRVIVEELLLVAWEEMEMHGEGKGDLERGCGSREMLMGKEWKRVTGNYIKMKGR